MNVMTGSPKVKIRPLIETTSGPLPNKIYGQNGNLISSTNNAAFISSSNYERIVYTTKRLNQRAKANQCNHVKETFHYSGGTDPIVLSYTNPGPVVGYTNHYTSQHHSVCNAKGAVLTAALATLGSTGGQVLGGGAQTYINDAWDRLRPDLTTVSIPNFILEFQEMRSLFQEFKRKVGLARKLAQRHLEIQFGWKPFLGDLHALLDSVSNCRSKLAAFEASLGRTFQGTTRPEHGLTTSSSGSFTTSNHTVRWQATCTRKLECFIAWQPQPLAVMGPMDKVLRGLLDNLGFELNPNIIWNAIPFTFVLDWFFDVGGWLNRYRVDALELPILMIDSFCQYKEDLRIEWTWQRVNDGTFTTRPMSGAASYVRNFFHRVPIYPDYAKMTSLGWKLPNFNQATLGVSLVTLLSKKKR